MGAARGGPWSEDVAVYDFWIGAAKALRTLPSLFRIKDERDAAPRHLFLQTSVFSFCRFSFALVAKCLLGGGRETVPRAAALELAGLVLVESRRCFQGWWPLENKGNFISQRSGCEQDSSLNAASSVVFLLPAKLTETPEPSFFHSFFLPRNDRKE